MLNTWRYWLNRIRFLAVEPCANHAQAVHMNFKLVTRRLNMEEITDDTKVAETSATPVSGRPKSGIPSSEQFFLPRKDTLDELLKKTGAIRTSTAWNMEDVMQFVFPQKYRSSYHAVAVNFLRTLQEKGGSLSSSQIGDFVTSSGASKATFYNKVLPRLVRVGMIDRNREPTSKKMTVNWSGQFSTYLEKIAFEWKRLEPRGQ